MPDPSNFRFRMEESEWRLLMAGARHTYERYYWGINFKETTGMMHLLWTIRVIYGAKNLPDLLTKDVRIVQSFKETVARHLAEGEQRARMGNLNG